MVPTIHALCTRKGVWCYIEQVFPSCLLAVASGMKRSIISFPALKCYLCFTFPASYWWRICPFIPSLGSRRLIGDQANYMPSSNQFSHSWVPNSDCYRNGDLQSPSDKNMGSIP